jgi:hypothetical protein
MTSFPPDPSVYRRVKEKGRFCVKCQATTEANGTKKFCDYSRREDHHKKAVSEGIIHVHHFVQMSNQPTLDTFYPHDFVDPDSVEVVTEDSLHDELAALVGRKNLSFATGACTEMHLLMLHCIQFGMSILNPGVKDTGTIAKQRFHSIGPDTLRTKMISVSDAVHRIAMKKFSEIAYTSVSIDAGALHTTKSLDFVLENPHSGMRPYPAVTVALKDTDAPAYVIAISQGLYAIHKYGIRISAVVCDGLLSQKKAFDINWPESIRNRALDEWLQQVLFVPCLCHRVSNAYKYTITHDQSLTALTTNLHQISTFCRTNIKAIGAICPRHIDTRWICDYDILFFIRSRKDKIAKYGPLEEALDQLFQVCTVFKALVLILEDPKRPHYEAYLWLERAIFALNELSETNSFAQAFAGYLAKYTLNAEDGGCWSLSYLLTQRGQRDFLQRSNKKQMSPLEQKGFLQMFTVKGPNTTPDELQILQDEMIQKILDEIPDEEAEEHGETAPMETGLRAPDVPFDPSSTPMAQNEEPAGEILPSLLETDEEYHVAHSNLHDPLTQARDYLFSVLISQKFGKISAQHIVAVLNQFIEWRTDQIPLAMASATDDFNWSGQRLAVPKWAPLADIAMRLHACPCSEAECERTISAQRLILTSKRLNSKKRTNDARLTLMKTGIQ